MCIYVFDKVLNCFWNLYSSLCSFCDGIEKCLFVDRCVTSGASLFQVFRQWRVAQNRAEGKKAKERNWERGGKKKTASQGMVCKHVLCQWHMQGSLHVCCLCTPD